MLVARQDRVQPIETLPEAFARCGHGRLYVPRPLFHVLHAKFVHNSSQVHAVREVLLVRVHKNCGISKLVVVEDFAEFRTGKFYALGIIRVYDVNDCVHARVIVPPKFPENVLPSDVPDRHLELFVLDSLHVEADGRAGGYDFAEFQLVQDGRLPGRVETHHDDLSLLPAPTLHKLRDESSHFVSNFSLVRLLCVLS